MGAAVQQKAGANGETPLHTAARIKEGKACVEMLIKSGAQINAVEAVSLIFKTSGFKKQYTFRMEKTHCTLPQERVFLKL